MKINSLYWAAIVVSFSSLLLSPRAQVATVNAASIKQTIEGFGASTAWNGQISDAEADASFNNSNNNQLGLTILRVRIDPSSGSWNDEKANAQKAKARGAKIVACPWTPPASMKTNNNVVGGELKTDSYAAYAAHLKSFCDNLGNVDILSIQNEPNIKVSYESCTWSATQLLNFCKSNASAIGKPIMMPEAFNFSFALSDSTLNDATARSQITYIGGHLYGTTPKTYTNAANNGKEVWMTEHYYSSENIDTCLTMAKEIVDCIYNNMSAYIWWYLRQPGCNIINSGGSIKKKGYILGQFSKYIRPGYTRIDVTYQPQTNVYVVGCIGAQIAIVAVNKNTASISQTFSFQNCAIASLEKYTTSSVKNLSDEGALNVSGNSLTTTLDAQSVTTFTGKAVSSIDFSIAPSGSSVNGIADLHSWANPTRLFTLNGRRFAEKRVRIGPQRLTAGRELNDLPSGIYLLQSNEGNKTTGIIQLRK